MRIDSVRSLCDEYPFHANPTFVLSEQTQEISVLQLEADDTFEMLLATLHLSSKSLILALPEQNVAGTALSVPEHVVFLRQQYQAIIRCILIPPQRLAALGEVAQQQGFTTATTLEQALTRVLDTATALTQPTSERVSEPISQKSQTTGKLYPQFQQSLSLPTIQGTGGFSGLAREEGVLPVLPLSSSEPALPPSRLHQPVPIPPTSLPPRNVKKRTLLAVICVMLLVSVCIGLLPWLLFTPSLPLMKPTSLPVSAAIPVGQIMFESSGQLNPTSSLGINDQVIIQLSAVAPPLKGTSLYTWLLPDTTNDEQIPLFIGTLHPDTNGHAQLAYQSPENQDLLASYSRVLVTDEASSPIPMMPSLDQATWKYQGGVPNTPALGDENHFSLLDHLRHLLAKDPDLEQIGLAGGLTIWLYRNSQKIMEWSNAARDNWTNADVTSIRSTVTKILDYLDGEPSAWRDLPSGTPFLGDLPAGRIGLLEIDQNETPPAYLVHIMIHLTGLVDAPGSTAQEKQIGAIVGNALKPITTWLQHARTDAVQLAQMTDQQLTDPQALMLLNDLVIETTDAFAGQIAPGNTIQGIAWIYSMLETLAVIPIISVSHTEQ